ncbi:MAG TPA: extracellular solute-binding protein [Stellaceae bacterium]|jgi:microcin C transport system substrate-binding protein|nr:extracellular solute-binding protein [Stellaceae bacterium]
MRKIKAISLAALFVLATIGAAQAVVTYGMSLYGEYKYPPNFTHFDYANPDAPKGGAMRLSSIGTYDTLNPFVIKGVPAAGISQTFDTLMVRSEDEAATDYPLIAESADLAPDRTSVVYNLNPNAKFHDGSPITPADVVWSFETLRDKGAPMYRFYYGDVTKVEVLGDHAVKFHFKNGDNRELPAILSEMPVLSKAYWSGRDFEKTTLEPPLGSGPYKIEAVDPGRSITYRRVADYWARDLPVNKGRFNVDTIRYDYYRDGTVALEAFKAGAYDIRPENSSKSWSTGYDGPALRDGLIKKITIPNNNPAAMQGFIYNLRRPLFQDPRVREALIYAFDFEWSNANLFYGAYTRTRSYYDNSELAATGVPQGEELKILEPFRGQVPDEVFTKEYNPPKYDEKFTIRDGLRRALTLLKEAGWTFKGEQLVNDKTGQPFQFEFLNDDPQIERVALPFIQNLKRLGITANLRTVDVSQYEQRMQNFDYDMTVSVIAQSLSPGNEQREFFGSAAADNPGSQNLMGIKSKVIDQLIEELITSPTRADLVAHVHALDRVLQYGYYLVPQYHLGSYWVAYWDKFRRPETSPRYAPGLETWWVDTSAEQAIETKKPEEAQKGGQPK